MVTWNANGTLGTYAIADNLPGAKDTQTCNYFYDDLGRLGGKNASGYSVDCGSTHLQDLYSFDPFGNIAKSGTFNFNASYSTATNHITGMTGVQYDSNGNLTQDNLGTQYTWTAYGNPASINTTNLVYDALGQMVEQQNGSTYTQMLYSQMGKTAIMNGQTLQKSFVSLPGGGTAIYNSSGTLAYYRHGDWLGSSRLTTTTSRTVYSDSAYEPFGQQYDVSGTADASFTGQDADTNSNLYDFTFREFSPSQGRWVSPDPAGGAAGRVAHLFFFLEPQFRCPTPRLLRAGSFAVFRRVATWIISYRSLKRSWTGVQYDSNGNLTQDNLGTQYTWTAYGNPASINTTNLVYDALGQMVEQQNGSTYTQMLYRTGGPPFFSPNSSLRVPHPSRFSKGGTPDLYLGNLISENATLPSLLSHNTHERP